MRTNQGTAPQHLSTPPSYWREVQIKADLGFDWYLATKHTCVHYMKVKLGLPDH